MTVKFEFWEFTRGVSVAKSIKRRYVEYMNVSEVRKQFLEFFAKRGHVIVPSSSLIPDDPSVLLTTAGMQQFKKYYTGEADPMTAIHPVLGHPLGSRNAVSVQKSFRTSDIDEVGDGSHLTFFEMLGHFSFGDYFKKETIEWTFEFLTKVLSIPVERISATVFKGDDKIPCDKESYEAWSQFLPEDKIKRGPREDNVWGPAGPEGPCGAANEVYVDNLEVATLVFMEYFCAKDQRLMPLPRKGVDVGWGFERLAMIVQNKNNIFETDLFSPFLQLLPVEIPDRARRIIGDHVRGSAFLLADGVWPSNKERGYIQRRLIRRAVVYEYLHHIPPRVMDEMLRVISGLYGEFYPEVRREQGSIREEFGKERKKFLETLVRGIKEFEKEKQKGVIASDAAFRLYETYGIPFEIIKELGGSAAEKLSREVFDEEFRRHQEISRAGRARKFGGHGLLLDTGELKAADERELKIATRLHTATHLLNAALRAVLGAGIEQQGSDITVLRTRFDFTFLRKLTPEEIQKIEAWVNNAIKRNLTVECKEMSYAEALNSGAIYFWREKYPPRVNVYTVFDPETGEVFSKELCGGPHVSHTGEIMEFKIVKEESSSAGIRRIRAVIG